jgi:hypothetical protein
MTPLAIAVQWTGYAFAMFVVVAFLVGLAFPYIVREIWERRSHPERDVSVFAGSGAEGP